MTIGHFANMCGSKVVHTLKKEDLDKSSSEVDCYPFLGELTVSEITSEAWRIKAIVDGNSLMFKIDSGADVTAIPANLYHSGNFSPLEPTALKLQGPRRSPIEVKEKMLTTISIKDKVTQQEVFVVPNIEEPLLGRPAIEKLNVLQVKANVCSLAKSRLDPYTEYKDLFEGLGEFKEQYKIELTEDAKPYALSTPRRIPIPQMPLVEKELKSMESKGVISKVQNRLIGAVELLLCPSQMGV